MTVSRFIYCLAGLAVMLWVFLGELQWGSRYHGANEPAAAREPLNYGTEEQLITTSVI